jgi:5'-deoxynucleotidase YfbR-like HD superfamily hydrolase
MGNICTHSGRLVDPWDLQPEDVSFHDVAWALSHLVRFVGHVDRAWSVADHTLFVARILREWGLPKRVQLLGLIHDADEAYLSDLASPTKAHLPTYKAAEKRAQAAIEQAAGFGIGREGRLGRIRWWTPVAPPADLEREWVEEADRVALVVEAERMLPQGAWKVDEGWARIVHHAGTVEAGHRMRISLTRWELLRPRRLTRRAWLREFRRLTA